MAPERRNAAASTAGTPYGTPGSVRSDWSTASNSNRNSNRSESGGRQLVSQVKPSLSLLKQEILTEEEYIEGIDFIIKRDFFPQLRELDAHTDLVKAYKSEDPMAIEESVRRMREIVTPTPHRRSNRGRTPFGTEPSDTPTYFSETPSTRGGNTRSSQQQSRPLPQTRYDVNQPLDHFQSRYTSEDNSSFAVLLLDDNKKRREKYHWAWEAEKRANIKAIASQEARVQLVEMTRKMVESDKDGVVRMIDGGAGRPGDRQLVVTGLVGGSRGGGALMVEGKTDSEGRLMILPGDARVDESKGKGKGKKVATSTSRDIQFVDWEKATAEEDEDNRAPKEVDTQVRMEAWKFTNRNSFMFPPDADVPMDRDPIQPEKKDDGVPAGEPKSIRYHATRLEEMARAPKNGGAPSPTRSRINAAISGTPYHSAQSSTPKVRGFSFVDALPTPRASTIDPQSLQDLMTWGTIESTPIALRSTGSIARSALGDGGGPFKIVDTSRRENLAHKLANNARKSLSQRAGSNSSSSGSGLRRRVLDGSIRGSNNVGGESPRTPNRDGNDLSPAAKNLLGRTGQGKALKGGMATSSTEWEDENRRKLERARIKAREVESREKLKRERWSPSPQPSLGFDPDLP